MEVRRMRMGHVVLGAALLLWGCGGKTADCRAVAKVLKDSGAKLSKAAEGKPDTDPALPKMLDEYASDLKGVSLSDATISKQRDDYAASLSKQATAVKAWQTANTANDAAGKTAASAQLKAGRDDQDKVGKELIAYCAK